MLTKRGDGGESGSFRRLWLSLPGGQESAPGAGGSGGSDDSGGDRADGGGGYDELIEEIDKAAASVARSFGYSPQDSEDFRQSAHVYLLEQPHILQCFRGGEEGCSLRSYLFTVLRRHALDTYRHLVGKWHSTAEVKRLGREAEALEALRYRDRLDLELAITRLLEKFPGFTREQALALDEKIKPRGLREWVGPAPLETIAADSRADENVTRHELEEIEQRVRAALQEALAALDPIDRVMIKAIFGKGQSIRDFAHFQGTRPRRMYSHFDRLRASLRKKLESLGIEAAEAMRLIGWNESALSFDLDAADESEAEDPNDKGGKGS